MSDYSPRGLTPGSVKRSDLDPEVISSAVAAEIRYVSPFVGSDITGDGTINHPWASVQYAIDNGVRLDAAIGLDIVRIIVDGGVPSTSTHPVSVPTNTIVTLTALPGIRFAIEIALTIATGSDIYLDNISVASLVLVGTPNCNLVIEEGVLDFSSWTGDATGLSIRASGTDASKALIDAFEAASVGLIEGTFHVDGGPMVSIKGYDANANTIVDVANPVNPQDAATKKYVDDSVLTPSAHAPSHQNGGGDEVDVTGLSGILADNQPSDHTTPINAHAAIAGAHHSKYLDSEAVTAMGIKGDSNPLNHDRPPSLPPTGAAGGDLTGTYPNPSVVAASQTVAGKVERASQAEVDAATDNIRYISPDKLPKNNYAASTDPSANSDTTVGYRVGSIWINTTDDIVWKCVDATTATAIWVPISHPIRFVKVRGDRNFKNLTYKTEDSFLWEGSDYNKYTSRKLEFIIDLNGSTDPVSVRVYNVTDITELGSLTGINTAGFKEFTFTQPVSTEALIEIQLKKDTDVSTDPIMNCSTIELERPMA